MTVKVILISGKARNGKDSTAEILKEYFEAKNKKVLITHYGDLVKYVCKMFFGWNGIKDEYARGLLQRVGTDEIRSLYPDFWVKFVHDILCVFNSEWDYVLIPDCRFPNEITYFKNNFFETVTMRINRLNFVSPLTPEQQQHSSETALDNYTFDHIINSESGLDNLKKEIMKIAGDL